MHKPFAILEEWVRQGGSIWRLPLPRRRPVNYRPADPLEDRDDLQSKICPAILRMTPCSKFAMRDVKSLGWSAVPLVARAPVQLQSHDHEREALRELEEFFEKGKFELEQTGEYIEGSNHPRGKLLSLRSTLRPARPPPR